MHSLNLALKYLNSFQPNLYFIQADFSLPIHQVNKAHFSLTIKFYLKIVFFILLTDVKKWSFATHTHVEYNNNIIVYILYEIFYNKRERPLF